VAAAHVVVPDLSSASLTLADEDAHHLASVLRLRVGEPVTATDGQGSLVPCRYGGRGELTVDGPVVRAARRLPLVTVAFAPVKGDRPEWAVQKLTELGVDRIVVLQTARSVVRWSGPRASSHLDRLRKVARGAVMQSRQVWLPEVEGPVPFEEAVGWPGVCVADGSAPVGPSLDRPVVLIGPEGGWAPEELAAAAPAPAPGLEEATGLVGAVGPVAPLA
jgi:16S rRNA (uracil1498-N3)-methyltransferase